MKNMKQIACLLAFTAVTSLSFAQNQQGGEPGGQGGQGGPGMQQGGHRKPPKEALEACKSKKAGDSCSFTSPHGNETGTCFTPESSKPLACKPSNMPEYKK